MRVRRKEQFLPKTAHGSVEFSEYAILVLGTSDGETGLGEVTCSPGWNGEEMSATCRLIDERLAHELIGFDPADWVGVASAVDSVLQEQRPFLRAAVEMACLDATGRRVGLPVAGLLGGLPGRPIETKIVLPAREPARVGEMAHEATSLGAQTLKVKVGLDAQEDLKRVEAVRAAIADDIPIIVDANEGWSVEVAYSLVPPLLDLGVVGFEQPMGRHQLAEHSDLRKATGALLIADESMWTWRDLISISNSSSFDVVSLYPGKCGGFRRTIAMAEAAADLGLGVTIGSNLELGIGTAALAHTAVSVRALCRSVPSDVIGALYFETPLIADSAFVQWKGAACPSLPGLGVSLDNDQLAAAHRRTDFR